MKTIKIPSNTVKGGGSHPSDRKPKSLKSLSTVDLNKIKGGNKYAG
jgi:hypothetical protein